MDYIKQYTEIGQSSVKDWQEALQARGLVIISRPIVPTQSGGTALANPPTPDQR